MTGENAYYSSADLYESIEKGDYPSWTWFAQIVPEADAAKYKWDIFDVTKSWCHKDYPLIEVGRVILNANPKNYFAEVEEVAFNPANLVPGIEPSNDRLL
jgi:catalase